MRNKTIAVTGSSGFIASYLIKELEKENPKKILEVDLKTGYNLTEYREMETFFEQNKVDVVFDLATLPLPVSLKCPYKVVNDIVKMVLNLCEIQRLGLFGKLVHISSSEVYGNAITNTMSETHSLRPRTPYASGKASADIIALSYVKTFGNDIIIPRCYNAYGPAQPLSLGAVIPKTINKIINKEPPIIFKDGKQTRDFTYVEDLAIGILKVGKLKEKGIVVNIGTGIETSITDLIKLICNLMNYTGKIKYCEQRQADVLRHCADTTLLEKLTGYKPDTSLQTGLTKTINYYDNWLYSNSSI